MKPFLATFVLFALVVPDAVQLETKYAPTEVRRTTFSSEVTTALVEMSMIQDGEEMPSMSGFEQEMDSSRSGAFVERTHKVDGHRRLAFEREYLNIRESTSMEMTNPMGNTPISNGHDADSQLNGIRVRFDLEEGEFVASFPEHEESEEHDEDLLEGLEAEQPWPLFLSENEVEVGDQWELTPDLIWRAIKLGGELSFEKEAGPMDEPSLEIDSIEFEGTITAKLAAVEDIDGSPHAEIALAFEIVAVQDLTELIANFEPPEDAPSEMMMPDFDSMITESAYSGEATLSWNIEAGAMRSFEMEYELEYVYMMEISVEMGPELMEIEQTMISEGEGTLSVTQEVESE